jgi:hypothetical protein
MQQGSLAQMPKELPLCALLVLESSTQLVMTVLWSCFEPGQERRRRKHSETSFLPKTHNLMHSLAKVMTRGSE